MKVVVIILFFCVVFFSSAQNNNDTIWLKPIDISAPATDSLFMFSVLNKLAYSVENLSVENVLARHTPVFFKNYSPGGTSTVSHRGFGASQTLLVWNGFALNQLTLGQPALNGMLVNDNVQLGIVSGTLAASDFSGGLSSYIFIDDIFYRDSSVERRLSLSNGSFGTKTASVFLEHRIKKNKISVELAGITSKNDYKYKNNAVGATYNDWPVENRISASFHQFSIKSNFLLPLKKGDLKFSLWAGSSFNESPAPIFSPQLAENESQQSKFVRFSTYIPLISNDNAGLQLRLFFSADTFLYKNKQLLISDGTASQSFATRLTSYLKLGKEQELHLEYYPEIFRVVSDNFSKPVLHSDQRMNLKFNFSKFEFIKLSMWTNLVTRDFNQIFPLPGLSLKLLPSNTSNIKGQKWTWINLYMGVARNMRMPTMNDLYWVPGGNPLLKPEDAWMADFAAVVNFYVKKIKFDCKAMPFYSKTYNLIHWTPDSSSSQWHAANISKSLHYGIEGTSSLSYVFGKNKLSVSANAARVFAFDVSTEKTFSLIYVPDLTVNTFFVFEHGIWSGGYEYHYTGKRFSSSDNDRYMPEIFLHDVFFSISKRLKAHTLSFSLRVNNILNADYQYIAWYPMPRRNFFVTLKWKWNE
jgi:iron complex outermembrane receptor protein